MGYHTCCCDSGSRRFDSLEDYEELPTLEDDLYAFEGPESRRKTLRETRMWNILLLTLKYVKVSKQKREDG
jgi:hypothetical protein